MIAAREFTKQILSRATRADVCGKDIILAVDTGWIPSIQRPFVQGVFSELEKMSRKNGFGNVKVVRGSDPKKLAGDIVSAASEKNTPMSNVVIIGEKEMFRAYASEFERMMSRDGETGAFFAEIVLPKRFPNNGDIKLFQIMRQSLYLAFSDPATRRHSFMIRAEPHDLQLLKASYELQKEILIRA
jgi:hypothetical protein